MEADNILVLKHGEIVEEGTHIQLMHKKQHYYRMWTYQYPRVDQGAWTYWENILDRVQYFILQKMQFTLLIKIF